MTYDFDDAPDRGLKSGSYSMKWDVKAGELPMWVADMDFKTAPEVIDAMQKRLEHGVFGYTDIPHEWNEAVAGWWRTRHDFAMQEDALVFCTGVVPALSSIVRKLTTPAEKVLIQTPVYNIFYNSILNNGRTVVESPLAYDGKTYSIDFADLEAKLSDPQVTLMIVCNPHNPTGNIWTAQELARIGELCAKHGVTVVSDEIHCDITEPGFSYTPFAKASPLNADISVTCIAASKAFNIAGLQSAAVYAENRFLRHKVWRGLNTDEVAEPNAFAIQATVAAFTKGGEWLTALCAYLAENRRLAESVIQAELPEAYAVPAKATYLLWLDCSAITEDSALLAQFLREKTGLYVSAGAQYGQCGKQFLRINLACPKARVQDGMERLVRGIKAFLTH
ncbi:MAG: pyridoxal phosphate-dependent aminotransferase [Treponema sp.]|nr:pyridoxal phosphate-dependent aminotransferase [Treponema sp.]